MDPKAYIRNIASHYPDEESIRRVLEFSFVDTVDIDVDGKPLSIWYHAIKEVMRQDKLAELVSSLAAEYPALNLTSDQQNELKKFLAGNNSFYQADLQTNRFYRYFIFGLSAVTIAGIFYFISRSGKTDPANNNLLIALHQNGSREIRPVSNLGMMTIEDIHSAASISKPIGKQGIVNIFPVPDWLKEQNVKLYLHGLDNDTATYSITSEPYALTAGDTNWMVISKVLKSNAGLDIHNVEFIRLRYKSIDFDFPGNKIVMQLKKYLITALDKKSDINSQNCKLSYLGEDLANDVIISTINWVSNRSVQLEYGAELRAYMRTVSAQIDGVDLSKAMIFFGDHTVNILEASEEGTKFLLPKITGKSQLEIYHNDNLTLLPVNLEYSTSGVYFPKEEFIKHSQKIIKVVN